MNPKGKHFSQIDFLRAVAVILVMFYHFNIYFSFIPGYNRIVHKGGELGVNLFFILSGFLMSKFYLPSPTRQKPSWIGFYKARFFRIVPLYIITSLIFYLLRNNLQVYKLSNQAMRVKDFILGTLFIDNKLFLLNPVLWTLKVEMIFYLFFPAIGFCLYRWFKQENHTLLFALPAILSVISVLTKYFGFDNLFLNHLEGFGTGIGVFIVCSIKPQKVNKQKDLIIPILLFIGLMFLSLKYSGSILFQLGICLAFGFLFWALLQCKSGTFFYKLIAAKPFHIIALLSYSIYLIHFNIYYNLCMPFFELKKVGLNKQHTYSFISASIVTMVISTILYFTIEKPILLLKSRTNKLKPFLNKVHHKQFFFKKKIIKQ